jgi:hypothetical protein
MSRVVLLVDDESLVREVAASMLEDLGCEVTTATGAIEALEKLSTDPRIEILITDIKDEARRIAANIAKLTGRNYLGRMRTRLLTGGNPKAWRPPDPWGVRNERPLPRGLAIGPKRGPLGKFVIVVGQPVHDLDCFGVFHRGGQRTHLTRAVAPLRVVDEALWA